MSTALKSGELAARPARERTAAGVRSGSHPAVGLSSRAEAPVTCAIVVPCYNEEESLPNAALALSGLLAELRERGLASAASHVCFVDDGSRDETWNLIAALAASNPDFRGIRLTRNFGHQGAVLAGMFECDADTIITIDADLQDDERCIATMLEKYRAGMDVVLGVREDRSSDSFFKRFTAEAYYRVLGWLGVKVTFNHADFRLMSRRAIEILKDYGESNLFLRGMVPLVGLRSCTVPYARRERLAGESKYPLGKMLGLAWEGITSFSIAPLRIVSGLGALIALGALAVTGWAFYVRVIGGGFVPGWASTVVPMYFLGGVQILCLGVLGEYVGKIYLETKRRPRYLVDVDTRRNVN